MGERQQGQRTAHAKAGDANLRGARFEELHRAANVLRGGIAKVERAHEVVCFFRFDGGFASVQVGHQCLKAGNGKAICDAANLVIEPPPFLDDHNGRGLGFACRLGQVAL